MIKAVLVFSLVLASVGQAQMIDLGADATPKQFLASKVRQMLRAIPVLVQAVESEKNIPGPKSCLRLGGFLGDLEQLSYSPFPTAYTVFRNQLFAATQSVRGSSGNLDSYLEKVDGVVATFHNNLELKAYCEKIDGVNISVNAEQLKQRLADYRQALITLSGLVEGY